MSEQIKQTAALFGVEPSIPALLTSTVGRASEIHDVVELITSPDVRLLVLTGPGGTGKTRVAIESAARARGEFSDGAWFVPLAPVRDPAGLFPAIASRLGVREAGGRAFKERLATRLDSRELLLVLDNFEQIAAAAPDLVELLESCPLLTLLVTSRTVLHVSAEHTYEVPPLAVSSEDETGDVPDAACLFEDRARAAIPGFALRDDNLETVLEICRKLDGLPLAIELSAARLRHLPLSGIADRLDHRLALLNQGNRDQPDRLRTMRNAIAWSYELLSPEQQRLFERLSVFPGGFTLDAAFAIADGADEIAVFDQISYMMDSSLLRQLPHGHGQVRYRMLEVIREFGLEQLALTGASDQARECMTAWVEGLVQAGWPAMAARVDQNVWLHRFDAELANFRAAMSWLDERQDGERLTGLAGGLFWFWYIRGHYTEGRAWLRRARECPGAPESGFAYARASYGLGILSHFQGDDAAAASYVDAALSAFREIDDEWGRGICYLLLGIIAEDDGEYDRALDLITRAIEHSGRAGDRVNLALSTYHLGIIHWGTGALPAATETLQDAFAQQQLTGDRWGEANSRLYLGLFSALQGHPIEANEHLQRSVDLRLELGTPFETEEMANYLANVAVLADRTGQSVLSARLLGAEHAIRSTIGAFRAYPERTTYESTSARTRDALGDDAFDRYWNEGQASSLNDTFGLARAFSIPDNGRERTRPEPGLSHPVDRLTPREKEILRLIETGRTNAEIAREVFVTPGTVRIHVSNILRKLGAGNRTEAVAIARTLGYLAPSS